MAIWVHDRSLEMLNFHPPTRSNRDKIAEQGHISTCSFALNDSTCEHRDFGRRGGSPRTLPAGSREPQGSRGTPPLRSIVISPRHPTPAVDSHLSTSLHITSLHIPERTRPLANYAYYPLLGLLPRHFTLSSKMIGSSAAGPFFEVVFALLVTELAIIGMLCVPVPGGLLRPVVRWVSTSSMLASLAKPLMWFGTLVGLSFLFTTREMLKLQEEYHDAKEYHDLGQKLQEPDRNPNPNPNPSPKSYYNVYRHHASHQLGSKDDLCGDGNLAQYEEHMAFRFASVRAARFGGALIWHSGLMTSFVPNMRYGGAVSRSQDRKLPQGARHLSSAWQCRSKDRLYLLYDSAARAARRHGAAELDAITISDAWPDDTIDNRHFDGGHTMKMPQGTSSAVLNELLNVLSREARRQGD